MKALEPNNAFFPLLNIFNRTHAPFRGHICFPQLSQDCSAINAITHNMARILGVLGFIQKNLGQRYNNERHTFNNKPYKPESPAGDEINLINSQSMHKA